MPTSSENFKSIVQEVQSLHVALKTADEVLSAQSFSTEQASNRDTILVGCHGVLHDLDGLVGEYLNLEKKKKWSLSRVRFGSEDLTGIRARLTSNIGILNTFIIAALENQRVQNTIRRPHLRSVHTITEIHIYQYSELQIPHFITRDEASEALDREFKNASNNRKRPPVVILLGMGGAGKTQLALDYCRRAEEDGQYDSIFWVDARSPSTVTRSFELLAEEIYGSEQKFPDSEATIASITRTLRQCKNTWLMVFDNFDQPDQFPTPVSNYWPNTVMGAILFTSRHETSKLLGSIIEVSRMSDEEGIKLLVNRIGRSLNDEDKVYLRTIVLILGNLALVID